MQSNHAGRTMKQEAIGGRFKKSVGARRGGSDRGRSWKKEAV
jgi:hypothetical protein